MTLVDRMNERTRVLFLAPVEPWCRENGASLITADLLEGLARDGGTDLLAVFARRPPDGYERHPAEGIDSVLLDVEGLPRWLSIMGAVLRLSSPLRMRFNNRAVARRVLAAVRERGFTPDVVHVEHLPLVDIGRMVARTLRRPLVYRAHNIESELWARRLPLPGVLGRAVTRHLGRVEAQAMAACDVTLCISDVDLAWARAHAPKARLELLPCSLLTERYAAIQEQYRPDPRQICFVGGLEWGPNESGLRWFVDEVFPRILEERPDAVLAVLARGAAERPWLAHPSIRIVPAQGDARALFASSRVSVAPLLQGGGVRIKIPESLALGCPVVATPIGGEGLDLPGLTTTADPAAFAAACVRQLDQKASEGDRQSLRASVDARHGATILASRLKAVWEDVMAPTQAAGRQAYGAPASRIA